MMQLVLARSFKADFAAAAAVKREDILQREKMARYDARVREQREERVEKEQDDADAALLDAVFASPADLSAFRVELDSYDTATVEALMENQEALDAVRERIDAMLNEATVLPDGRRVFKTRDGQRVFDEHGQEVASETIAPDAIDDRKPRWESLSEARREDADLQAERGKLLEFQIKLDDARERVDAGDLTVDELDALRDSLKAEMPDAIRVKIAPDAVANRTPETTAEAAPLPDTMDAMMRRTGLGPSPTTLG